MTERVCSKCKKSLIENDTNFYYNWTKNVYRCWCKTCEKKQVKERYDSNPVKFREIKNKRRKIKSEQKKLLKNKLIIEINKKLKLKNNFLHKLNIDELKELEEGLRK
jgi:hypothetical protein